MAAMNAGKASKGDSPSALRGPAVKLQEGLAIFHRCCDAGNLLRCGDDQGHAVFLGAGKRDGIFIYSLAIVRRHIHGTGTAVHRQEIGPQLKGQIIF